MDFLANQEAARRRARWLLPGLALAVLATATGLYLMVVLPWGIWQGVRSRGAVLVGRMWYPELFGLVAGVTSVLVGTGSWWKTRQLRRGGAAVAELLAARAVRADTSILAERQLLNVVAEMAVATGLPVPTVHVLEWDMGVNAFTAGCSPDDAVLGVSRGALDRLSRDELQGVIGHEFSHILNGDMQLNHRLIGLVHGLLFIALLGENLVSLSAVPGPELPRTGSVARQSEARAEADSALTGLRLLALVAGLGFSFIGFLGAAGARLIKSAVCREREFLADAAAVEFTRLARGLAGALKQAEQFTFTTSLRRTTSEELGHLFFNNACEHRLSDFAHTHPPLTERIRRLEPLIALELERARLHSAAAPSPAQPSLRADEALGRMNACGPARLEQASRLLAGWPEPLSQATRAPGPARAVIFALLCADATQPPPAILDLLRQAGESPLADEVLRLQPFARQLPRPARLPLAELAVPALREMSAAEFTRFDELVEGAIRADAEMSVFEFALRYLLRRHLQPHFLPVPPAARGITSLRPLRPACAVLLSALAHAGNAGPAETETAFRQGGQMLGFAADDFLLHPLEECTFTALDAAFTELAGATPQIRRRVLEAAARTAATDGIIRAAEAELLRAFADALGCPAPLFPDPAQPA